MAETSGVNLSSNEELTQHTKQPLTRAWIAEKLAKLAETGFHGEVKIRYHAGRIVSIHIDQSHKSLD